MKKTLDTKLAEIHADPNTNTFILADAKDGDMAFGICAAGKDPANLEGPYRSMAQYRELIRENVKQGLLDIVLMSAATSEILTIQERLFANSAMTPAFRGNDTTDVHIIRHSTYGSAPARPFRTALIDHGQCGHLAGEGEDRTVGADLALYSLTFNNDAQRDVEALELYQAFRVEAEQKGLRHFLEVFDPNAPRRVIDPDDVGGFVNDNVVRALAGVASVARPVFLKLVYHGPKYMEELAQYDHHLVPGILGGSSGTTHDAFKLLEEAKAHGARAALFGRKINNSEHQPTFIKFLHAIAAGEIKADEAVKAYHGALEGLEIKPIRTLDDDLAITNPAVGLAASNDAYSVPAATTDESTDESSEESTEATTDESTESTDDTEVSKD